MSAWPAAEAERAAGKAQSKATEAQRGPPQLRESEEELAAFEADPETKAIVMIGEIGGDAEERAAAFIQANVTKPVVGYVAGFTAPEGKTMGHAGAIIGGAADTADAKIAAFKECGIAVSESPA